MSDPQYAVLLSNGTSRVRVGYGPVSDKTTADQFAAFLTAEVDPAYVVPLRDMSAELLHWRSQLPGWTADASDAAFREIAAMLTEAQLEELPAHLYNLLKPLAAVPALARRQAGKPARSIPAAAVLELAEQLDTQAKQADGDGAAAESQGEHVSAAAQSAMSSVLDIVSRRLRSLADGISA
jgi:hypothetical protein